MGHVSVEKQLYTQLWGHINYYKQLHLGLIDMIIPWSWEYHCKFPSSILQEIKTESVVPLTETVKLTVTL